MQVVRWHSAAFLNVWGDDGRRGTRTFDKRLPRMVRDLVVDRPDVICLSEVRDTQEQAVTEALAVLEYVKIRHSNRLAIYTVPTIDATNGDFHQYPKQNKGAVEGILRQRLKIDGSWIHYGVTHLDFRDGFDEGRVNQMRQGVRAMGSFARRWDLPRWETRSVILGDFNSKAWVMERALEPAGFKDVGAGATIDFITVGEGRRILSASKRKTASDHPIVTATFGRIIEET